MYNPFGEGVPIYIGLCAIVAIVCSCVLLIGLVVAFHLEWLFLMVPISTSARVVYYIIKGK